MGISVLPLNTKFFLHSIEKPGNSKMLTGFFIGMGVIFIFSGFYFIGKSHVPEGVATDQMGYAIEQSYSEHCISDVQIEHVNQSNSKNQRQSHEIDAIYPEVLKGAIVNVILCNDQKVNIDNKNHLKFKIITKRNNKFYLLSLIEQKKQTEQIKQIFIKN